MQALLEKWDGKTPPEVHTLTRQSGISDLPPDWIKHEFEASSPSLSQRPYLVFSYAPVTSSLATRVQSQFRKLAQLAAFKAQMLYQVGIPNAGRKGPGSAILSPEQGSLTRWKAVPRWSSGASGQIAAACYGCWKRQYALAARPSSSGLLYYALVARVGDGEGSIEPKEAVQHSHCF